MRCDVVAPDGGAHVCAAGSLAYAFAERYLLGPSATDVICIILPPDS